MDERLNEINRELKELNEALARQGRMEAQWKDLQDQRAERDRRVMETGRVFRKEQDDVDRLEKGACGPCCSPSPGTGRCACPKSGGRPWPPSSSTIRPSGIWRISTGASGSCCGRRTACASTASGGTPCWRRRESCSKPWAGRPARLARLDQQLDELEHQRREVGRPSLPAARRKAPCPPCWTAWTAPRTGAPGICWAAA